MYHFDSITRILSMAVYILRQELLSDHDHMLSNIASSEVECEKKMFGEGVMPRTPLKARGLREGSGEIKLGRG